MTQHVVFYSGGIASWATAMRVAQKHGTDNLTLLFTDTKARDDKAEHHGEDEDAYRFLVEGARLVGADITWLSRGEHVWEVFKRRRYVGNTRVDVCSAELKRNVARAWVNANCDPADTVLYLGIDWSEEHRCTAVRAHWAPYVVAFPMCDKPYKSREEMCLWAEAFGVARPRLYTLGFTHNNCGGFCVKAGQTHFRQLLAVMPTRYAYHEAQQERLLTTMPSARPFLRRVVNGQTQYLSLREFRLGIEAGDPQYTSELWDIGGCGCFAEGDEG